MEVLLASHQAHERGNVVWGVVCACLIGLSTLWFCAKVWQQRQRTLASVRQFQSLHQLDESGRPASAKELLRKAAGLLRRPSAKDDKSGGAGAASSVHVAI